MTIRTLKIAAVSLFAASTALLAGTTVGSALAEAKKVVVIKVGHGHGHFHRHYPRYGGLFLASSVVGGDCYWLKDRALDTGSRYWWNRYYACRGY